MQSSAVQQIKERLSIEEVVGGYVELHPSGRHLKGKTPFGSERTPSFFVSPDKGLFYCFSTGKGGDIFSFMQEVEGVDFPTALKTLAARAGVELVPEDPLRRKRTDAAKEALRLANRFFQVQLRQHPQAVAYLTKRGLTKETIVKFQLGFAPAGNRLQSLLLQKGIPHQAQEEAGLISSGERGPYDRFRDRIMFPLWSPQGQVAGFTGRIFLPDNPEQAATYAKYMNSPENQFFHKSRVLYGYHLARKALMTSKKVVLVEGQFDVILSHQSGIEHCVGISGTALSNDQIQLIQRFADEVILVLDNDKAGLLAADRSAKMAYAAGLMVRAARLPEGQDPADVISEASGHWNTLVREARPYVEHRLALPDIVTGDAGQRAKKVHEIVFPLVASMSSAMQRDVALQRIAQYLELRDAAVRNDYEAYNGSGSSEQKASAPAAPVTAAVVSPTMPAPEVLLLGLFWSDMSLPSSAESLQALVARQVEERQLDQSWARWLENYESERETLVFRAELLFGTKPERLAVELERLLDIVQLQVLQGKFDTVLQALKAQERTHSSPDVSDLQTRAQVLSQTIQTIRSRLVAS